MKVKAMMAVVAAFNLLACNQIDLPADQTDQKAELQIRVRTKPSTKAMITDDFLPNGSIIALYLVDDSGVTYDEALTIATLSSDVTKPQAWTSTSMELSSTKSTLYSFYPIGTNFQIPEVDAIPVETASQTDYMWGTPVKNVYNGNNKVDITMNHALSAVRLRILKGPVEGSGNVTEVKIAGNGAATEALLNATDGSLDSFYGTGEYMFSNDFEEYVLGNEEKTVEIMVIPTGVSAPLELTLVIDDTIFSAETQAFTLEPGKVYEYTVALTAKELVIQDVAIEEWQVIPDEVQSYPDTDALETPIMPLPPGNPVMAAIQHKNGSYFTIEDWAKGEAEGMLSDSDANGVVAAYSQFFSCAHVIHPKKSPTTLSWSSNNTLLVPGVTDLLGNKIKIDNFWPDDYIEALLESFGIADFFVDLEAAIEFLALISDMNGKENTDALLAAVADGIIPDAPAAQYCAGVTFANGERGFLPSIGQMAAWIYNKDAINEALLLIGGDPIDDEDIYWTSTQFTTFASHIYKVEGNEIDFCPKADNTVAYARPVCEFNMEF